MGYGLVFAGGGGKGAYEVGVWKALKELGLDKKFTAVSGTSVGALNAALFCQFDYDSAEYIWNTISTAEMIEIKKGIDIIADYILNNRFSLASNENLKNRIKMVLNTDKIKNSNISLYVCCTETIDENIEEDFFSEWRLRANLHKTNEYKNTYLKCRYYNLNSKSRDEIINYLLASAALPIIFGGKSVGAKKYLDGGLFDNVPYKPLVDMGCEKILIVNLEQGVSGIKKYGNTYAYDIYPSVNIGEFIDGTIDFENENIKRRINFGYMDVINNKKDILNFFRRESLNLETDNIKIKDYVKKILS